MRIFSIVLSELAARKLKAEENLELAINSKNKTSEDKVVIIMNSLEEIAISESMIQKWQGYTTAAESNNNES